MSILTDRWLADVNTLIEIGTHGAWADQDFHQCFSAPGLAIYTPRPEFHSTNAQASGPALDKRLSPELRQSELQ